MNTNTPTRQELENDQLILKRMQKLEKESKQYCEEYKALHHKYNVENYRIRLAQRVI